MCEDLAQQFRHKSLENTAGHVEDAEPIQDTIGHPGEPNWMQKPTQQP